MKSNTNIKTHVNKIIILSILLVYMLGINIYAISDNFHNIINVMGIRKINNQGYEINEEIYYKYNLLVYGTPELAINESTQRWKNVKDGKWVKNGQRGEYRILGYNNIGKVVNNHEFPEDIVPSSLPTDWTYKELTDGLSSWNNTSLYMYYAQKDYMQNTNLIRNNTTYNLNCNDIGLNKTRVDNYATWKTKGVIYTNRIDPYGKVWEATFLTEPIGANVGFNSSLETNKNTYTMGRMNDYIDIPIIYGTQVTNTGKYITPQQVKLIETNVYVNDYKVLSDSNSNTFTTNNSGKVRIYRTMFENKLKSQQVEVIIKVRSKLFTQFTTDLPLYSKAEKTIILTILPWFIDSEGYMPPKDTPYKDTLNEDEYTDPIYEYPENNDDTNNISSTIDLRRITTKNNITYYEELNKTNSTNSDNSYGFINAGNYLGIKVNTPDTVYKVEMSINGDSSIKTFDDKTKRFEWDEIINRGEATRYPNLDTYYKDYENTLQLIPNSDNTVYTINYLIPYETKQTLHSWNSIRSLTGQSLNLDTNLLTNRIINPYTIDFDVYRLVTVTDDKGNVSTYTEIDKYTVCFDVFECWTNLYNRDITPYILNKQKDIKSVDEWIQ